jgi:hypothetical protein
MDLELMKLITSTSRLLEQSNFNPEYGTMYKFKHQLLGLHFSNSITGPQTVV